MDPSRRTEAQKLWHARDWRKAEDLLAVLRVLASGGIYTKRELREWAGPLVEDAAHAVRELRAGGWEIICAKTGKKYEYAMLPGERRRACKWLDTR